jgi:hypothetical protein
VGAEYVPRLGAPLSAALAGGERFLASKVTRQVLIHPGRGEPATRLSDTFFSLNLFLNYLVQLHFQTIFVLWFNLLGFFIVSLLNYFFLFFTRQL